MEKNINKDKDINDMNNSLSERNNKEKNIRIFNNEIKLIKNSEIHNSLKIFKNNDGTPEKNLKLKKYNDKNNKNPNLSKKLKKNRKIIKNISYKEISDYEIKDIKIKNSNNKSRTKDKKEESSNDKLILTKRNNEILNVKNKFNIREITSKNNFINKSAKTRKKLVLSDFIDKNNNIKKVNQDKNGIKYTKINIKQNKIDKQRKNIIIQKDSLNKFIDLSKIESPRDDSESISMNSKMILSPKALSSLNNENNIYIIYKLILIIF